MLVPLLISCLTDEQFITYGMLQLYKFTEYKRTIFSLSRERYLPILCTF